MEAPLRELSTQKKIDELSERLRLYPEEFDKPEMQALIDDLILVDDDKKKTKQINSMRYIDKYNRYAEFDEYVNNDSPSVWDEFKTDIKLKLHQHLWREQQGLCIYCQQEVPEKTGTEYKIRSHIEHIRPRSSSQYAHLTFCYNNLSF